MSLTYEINSALDDQERLHSSRKIMQILRPITAEEEYIFDDGNMSCQSEISDPFSDLDDSKIFQYQKRKRLSKLEGDILLMSSFPPEFLRVQEEVRLEMMLGPNVCSEDLKNIKFKSKSFELDEEFLTKVNEILQISQNMIKSSKEEMQLTRESAIKEKSRKKQPVVEDTCETQSLSGVWRMLDAETGENGFPITETGYNVYDDEQFNWLRRDNDVTWNDIEESCKKCLNWLNK